MPGSPVEMSKFCPRCGATGLDHHEKCGFKCPHCGFVLYFSPAAAVGGFILNEQGQMLWILRAKDPGMGKLGLPGGFVDAGETGEEAQHRETWEEVGLKLDTMQYLTSFPNRYVFKDVVYDTLDQFFICRVKSFASAHARDEVAELIIRRPEEVALDDIAFPSIRRAFEYFLTQHF